MHAVLGGFTERQTPNLKTLTTTDLRKLLHAPFTFTTDKNHNLPKRATFKDSILTKTEMAIEINKE
ncbi:MAG: hypothetical protein EHM20_06900 [Alphaproteobacteria bacterium]|nr:MAG: hypothetical protein EHM20_06900 [Alphaproteobacteria bacterium]